LASYEKREGTEGKNRKVRATKETNQKKTKKNIVGKKELKIGGAGNQN